MVPCAKEAGIEDIVILQAAFVSKRPCHPPGFSSMQAAITEAGALEGDVVVMDFAILIHVVATGVCQDMHLVIMRPAGSYVALPLH